MFAVAGYLLHKSGSYLASIIDAYWTGAGNPTLVSELKTAGVQWSDALVNHGRPLPVLLTERWKLVWERLPSDVEALYEDKDLVGALLDLVSAADIASEGFGLPQPHLPDGDTRYDVLERAAEALYRSYRITGSSSLCERVLPSALCVLPKVHTPQIGMTFRSLTHHLALWPKDELRPIWAGEVATDRTNIENAHLNLLLVPYPYDIKRSQFGLVKNTHCGRQRMADNFALFSYLPESAKDWLSNQFPLILQEAKRLAPSQRIDGVVFPELSLLGDEELQAAASEVLKVFPGAWTVGGFHDNRTGNPVNTAGMFVRVSESTTGKPDEPDILLAYRQPKHHRWQLETSQIQGYRLEDPLHSNYKYWEQTDITDRRIQFFPFKRSFTLCLLVCEDLARQEPASRLVRAVGPNLVIALLMDSQQLHYRWPARYASVLAEDPGSSVLSLTSLGMIKLHGENTTPDSPVSIGLWRDSWEPTRPRELKLMPSAQAVILPIRQERRPEYSTDGREYMATFCHLSSSTELIQVYQPNPKPETKG
ncbi:MAG: hypothetical protein JNJ83_04475 [Verrucomicrobiaceae bacterium]|nr:hypothetical protein [Verrucomicrobiaceae bacterium]